MGKRIMLMIVLAVFLAGCGLIGATKDLSLYQDGMLVSTYLEMRLYGDALATAQKTLARAEDRWGREDYRVGAFLSTLASVYREIGKFDKAEALLKRAEGLFVVARRTRERAYLGVLQGQGNLYSLMGKYDIANNKYKKVDSLARLDKSLPKLVVSYNASLTGVLLGREKKFEESENSFKDAINTYSDSHKTEKHKYSRWAIAGEYATVLRMYATMLLAAGKTEQALQQLSLASSLYAGIRKGRGTKDSIDDARLVYETALVHIGRNQPGKASSLLEQASVMLDKMFKGDHLDKAFVLFRQGQLLAMAGKKAEGVGQMRRAIGIVKNKAGSSHPEIKVMEQILSGTE